MYPCFVITFWRLAFGVGSHFWRLITFLGGHFWQILNHNDFLHAIEFMFIRNQIGGVPPHWRRTDTLEKRHIHEAHMTPYVGFRAHMAPYDYAI